MANNQEMYCEHCKKNGLFMSESDLLWNCDECGNAYRSIPPDQIEDEGFGGSGYIDSGDLEDIDGGDIIMCPFCKNLFEIDELIEGYLCPACLEDLSGRLENDEEL